MSQPRAPRTHRLPRGLTVARIAGITVIADWSVLVIAALFAWGIAATVVPESTPAWGAWLTGGIGALLLIASLAAHEMGHALVARRRGIEVRDVTLWLFGGVAHINSDWGTARTEMLVAVVGPAITLALTALLVGASWLLVLMGAPALAVDVAEWLGAVNLLLLIFNLVPAFPLDGGRILRAALWMRRGDRHAATVAAARGGRVFAALLVAGGLLEVLFADPTGGLWLMLIGWFLDTAARNESQGEQARHALEGLSVADVMSTNPVLVASWITVELLIDQYVLRNHFATFPIHGIDGRIEGVVTLNGIRRVPANQRGTRHARDIAIPLERVPVARPDEPLTGLLRRMTRECDGRALVFDGDRLVGIVSPSDIARMMHAAATSPPLSRPAA